MLIRSLGFSKMLTVQQRHRLHMIARPLVSEYCEWQEACCRWYSAGRFKIKDWSSLGQTLREGMWEVTMWTRCCAACRRVLRKARLCDHIRCECGWEW
jgi:hypothetical protein